MPELRFYDIDTDQHREPTQRDIDRMMLGIQAYGRMRQAYADTQEWLMTQLVEVNRRHHGVFDDQPSDPRAENDPVTGDL